MVTETQGTKRETLKRLKKLQLWYDRAIDAGSDWEKEIFQKLDEADIVLCLVSQDFINFGPKLPKV